MYPEQPHIISPTKGRTRILRNININILMFQTSQPRKIWSFSTHIEIPTYRFFGVYPSDSSKLNKSLSMYPSGNPAAGYSILWPSLLWYINTTLSPLNTALILQGQSIAIQLIQFLWYSLSCSYEVYPARVNTNNIVFLILFLYVFWDSWHKYY